MHTRMDEVGEPISSANTHEQCKGFGLKVEQHHRAPQLDQSGKTEPCGNHRLCMQLSAIEMTLKSSKGCLVEADTTH